MNRRSLLKTAASAALAAVCPVPAQSALQTINPAWLAAEYEGLIIRFSRGHQFLLHHKIGTEVDFESLMRVLYDVETVAVDTGRRFIREKHVSRNGWYFISKWTEVPKYIDSPQDTTK